MTTDATDMDGCDIAHERLMLDEYGEEVMSAGWIPSHTLMGENKVALAIVPAEAIDTGESFLSTALPQCP